MSPALSPALTILMLARRAGWSDIILLFVAAVRRPGARDSAPTDSDWRTPSTTHPLPVATVDS
ncbi:hypothetical protein GCM10012276_18780 [Nocardioides deserti]|nr:hypothetical protein GCM10012276_18780 [Nocardioides deserti]